MKFNSFFENNKFAIAIVLLLGFLFIIYLFFCYMNNFYKSSLRTVFIAFSACYCISLFIHKFAFMLVKKKYSECKIQYKAILHSSKINISALEINTCFYVIYCMIYWLSGIEFIYIKSGSYSFFFILEHFFIAYFCFILLPVGLFFIFPNLADIDVKKQDLFKISSIKKLIKKLIKKPFIVLFPFLPSHYEYKIAKYFKQQIKFEDNMKEREMKKDLITYFNHANFFATFLIILLYGVFNFFGNLFLITIYNFFIIFRVIGRSVEIIIAFYRDVTDEGEKKTNLSSNERISLAVRSFIEMTFLYAILYLLLKHEDTWFIINSIINNELSEAKVIPFVVIQSLFSQEFLAYWPDFLKELLSNIFISFGVMTYKSVAFDIKNLPIEDIVYVSFNVLQVITSMVLVVFSIAKYIGDKDT